MKLIKVAAVLWICLVVCTSLDAGNWPQWRGPKGNGVSDEKGLPTEWSDTKNVKWKAPVPGTGVSAPVIWDDAIFLTASDGRDHDRLHVLCYHRADGRLLWDSKFFGSVAMPQNMFPPGGMAVPTIATNGKHLCALFGTGDLVCLDFAGKPLWIRSLAQEYGAFMNRWGMAASPIFIDDLVIVQVDHWSQSYLLAVDAKTGATRWKTDRNESVNWCTPIVAQVKGKPQIVCLGTYRAKGYDPKTGEELWTVSGLEFQCIPSPVVVGDMLYAVSGRKGNTLAIKLDGSEGDVTSRNVLWKSDLGTPYVPSPVCTGDLYFMVNDAGIATCLNARSGDEIWQQRLDQGGTGAQYKASPLVADGKIYFTGIKDREEPVHSVITVIKADAKFQVLSKNKLSESIVAPPSVSNGQLFIRGEKHLYCIEEKK